MNKRKRNVGLTTLGIILIILLVVLLFGGYGLGGGIYWGLPGLILVILIILLIAGRL